MLPLLIDEGLPPQVAHALAALELPVHAVGDQGAPPKGSPDDVNVKWCQEHGAVLITNDWGRKDKIILDLLAQHRVHAIFVYDDLRAAPPHHLARAVLRAEERIEQIASSRKMIHHKLKSTGYLDKR